MNAVCFAPSTNATGKRDADYFARLAKAFMRLHGIAPGRLLIFDNTKDYASRAREALSALARTTDASLECVAFFGHGWRDGCQLGVHTCMIKFADALAKKCAPDVTIILYACSAGRDGDKDAKDDTKPGLGDDGGFADLLRDELVRRGMSPKIIAHTTDGDACENPYVRVFDKTLTASGRWLVEPKSKPWAKWAKALKDDASTLRYRFPFMSREAVEAELTAAS